MSSQLCRTKSHRKILRILNAISEIPWPSAALQQQQQQQQEHKRFYNAIYSKRTRSISNCSTIAQQLTTNSHLLSIGTVAGSNCGSFLLQRQHKSIFHQYKPVMDAPAGVFRGSVDRFNGITVESKEEFTPNENFPEKLQKSLDYWKQNKRRTIWFKVETEHAAWIPHLAQQNFDFHHANNGFVIMNRWLPTDESANIPVYAHTMLGVGGVVVNTKNEILVVSDRYAMIPGSWKLPGGYVEPNENLIDAAIREIREETGIETKFNTMVSIRHTHNGSFDCSDIYAVIGLTPLTSDVLRCEREIAKCKWMPCAEYLEHPHVHETNRHFLRTFLDYQKRGIRFTCEMGKHQILKKEYCLYFMEPITEHVEQKAQEKQQVQKEQSDGNCKVNA